MSDIVKEFKSVGYRLIHSHEENEGRDSFLVVEKNGVEVKVYVKFKKDYFNKFKDFFPHVEGKGDSINTEVFDKVIRLGTDMIVLVYPDQTLWAYPMLLKRYALAHGLVRKQLNPQKSTIKRFKGRTLNMNEETYCFPVKILQDFQMWLGEQIHD